MNNFLQHLRFNIQVKNLSLSYASFTLLDIQCHHFISSHTIAWGLADQNQIFIRN